jgi:hypothetical protein
MNEAEEKILEMVQDGVITAVEAEKLLAVLSGSSETAESYLNDTAFKAEEPPELIMEPDGTIIYPSEPPDMERFRRFWLIPFAISAAVLLVTSLVFFATYALGGFVAWLGFLCLGPVVALALLATIVTFWSRWAYWLHLRIKEKRGRRIAISLPLPLAMMRLILRFAGRYTGEDKSHNLSMMSALIDTLKDGGHSDPLMLSVDDDDGDQVQIYIG